MVAFMFFVKAESKNTFQKHACKAASDATKILGKMWKEMTDEQKKPYTDAALADQDRHKAQIKEFTDNGFFMMSDGTKSTDSQPKIKLGKRKTKNESPTIEASEKRVKV